MSVDVIDCSTLSPVTYPSPVYHYCWGRRALPSTMQFTAGPTTLIPPNTTPCVGWPTTVITGTMSRGVYGSSVCAASWSYINPSTGWGFVFNWTYPSGSQPVSCTIDMAEMFPLWVIGSNQAGITYLNPTGSCSQNPTTGVVTMTYSVTISNGLCQCPITVTFNG